MLREAAGLSGIRTDIHVVGPSALTLRTYAID